MLKQPVDETTSWWNNQLMKQPVAETASCWNNQLMKQPVDETTSGWNNQLMKQPQPVDKTARCWNNQLMKLPVDENIQLMKWTVDQINYFIVQLMKQLVDLMTSSWNEQYETTSWASNNLVKIHLTKPPAQIRNRWKCQLMKRPTTNLTLFWQSRIKLKKVGTFFKTNAGDLQCPAQ